MKVVYKRAEEENLFGVNELLINNFNHKLDHIIKTNSKYSFIALCDNEVIGHVFVTKIYNDIKKVYWLKLDYVCVKDNYRNLGIATKLIQELELMEKDIDYYELTCSKQDLVKHLYFKLGYSKVDTCLLRKKKKLLK